MAYLVALFVDQLAIWLPLASNQRSSGTGTHMISLWLAVLISAMHVCSQTNVGKEPEFHK